MAHQAQMASAQAATEQACWESLPPEQRVRGAPAWATEVWLESPAADDQQARTHRYALPAASADAAGPAIPRWEEAAGADRKESAPVSGRVARASPESLRHEPRFALPAEEQSAIRSLTAAATEPSAAEPASLREARFRAPPREQFPLPVVLAGLLRPAEEAPPAWERRLQ